MADDSRLNDLKLRWEQDPGSRLYLQLADEYRKLERYAEAIEVLTKGLEKRPSDLSGLVALGRCQLEAAELDTAAETLENVVARDPTHMVGNKLLLETYLGLGDATRAGERLDLYRVLNDRDPEIEHYEYRLRGLRSAEVASARELGYAQNREEWISGLSVLAAPVMVGGRLIAAVAVALPAARFAGIAVGWPFMSWASGRKPTTSPMAKRASFGKSMESAAFAQISATRSCPMKALAPQSFAM